MTGGSRGCERFSLAVSLEFDSGRKQHVILQVNMPVEVAFEVMETRGNIEDGKVNEWQVTVKVGFTLDK